jgi:hypothetical protein
MVIVEGLIERLPWEDVEWPPVPQVGRTVVGTSGAWSHPLLEEFRTIFDEMDALHLVQARLNDCDFFMTLDASSILKRVPRITPSLAKQIAPMRIGSPQQVLGWIR